MLACAFTMFLMIEGSTFFVFEEEGFPIHGVGTPLIKVPGADELETSDALIRRLFEGDATLVWRHGSTFPQEAFGGLIAFLENGGSILYLGGEPWTRPVSGEQGQRRVGPRTVSWLRELGLNQCYTIDVSDATLKYRIGDHSIRTLPSGTQGAILEPRLAQTKDFEHEDGAPGSRDAIPRAWADVFGEGDEGFASMSGAYCLEQIRGRFAGGRWAFRLLSSPLSEEELDSLLKAMAHPVVDFRLDPTFGCFHEGEVPSVRVSMHRPGQTDRKTYAIDLAVSPEKSGPFRPLTSIELGVRTHGQTTVPLQGNWAPGLYRIRARCGPLETETGFWIFDPELFTSGDTLSFDGVTMLRNGRPEPVVGTTVMSETVHRKFLFEPNAAVWDDTFGELASLNFNMVRTGIWSAYRKISLDPHVVDEAWLRALEAYYLTARKHGIPILFTFFAFIPEGFGSKSPYFDPRALEGQEAYVATVASRFASTKELLWDLINEPSFSDPTKLWKCRPVGDRYEAEAFVNWLEARYEDPVVPFDERVRARWRLHPGEGIGLPRDADFDDAQVFGDRRPYRAKEFARFAQDAFASWIQRMTGAIRGASSDAAITVGQDEGGLFERPGPLFHHRDVDFTSMHTWWFNDRLYWDGLMAKGRGTPLLFSESGIMQRELLSGEAVRDPDDFADLLSRKLGYAFASGGFGLVQWCYEVNPYMASDNEVGIGLKRVDGSFKPEHRVLRDAAAFLARHREIFVGLQEPEVVVVFPFGDHFSPRSLQTTGTQNVVRLLAEELHVPIQIVSESRTELDLGDPALIVLPSCRGVEEQAWKDILEAVERGSVLHCSGFFETDEVQLPALRLGGKPRTLAQVERTVKGTLQFDKEVFESWKTWDRAPFAWTLPHGQGHIHHYAHPVDWARPSNVQSALYKESLELAGIRVQGGPDLVPSGVVIREFVFRDAIFIVAINESSVDTTAAWLIGEGGVRGVLEIPARRSRMFVFEHDGRLRERGP